MAIIALAHLLPALAKAAVGWPGEAQLWSLAQRFWLKGWNTWLPVESMTRATAATAAVGSVLPAVALAVESGPLVVG